MTVLMSPIHRSMSMNSTVQAAPVAIWPLTDFDRPTMSTISADLNEPSPVPTGYPADINSRTANRTTSASSQVAIFTGPITRSLPAGLSLRLLKLRVHPRPRREKSLTTSTIWPHPVAGS